MGYHSIHSCYTSGEIEETRLTMSDFPGKGKVAVLKTSPATILDDIEKLMKLADFNAALPKEQRTGLKINISWQTWYPACSSTPWQIEGVIRSPAERRL